jgi:hypothetical protein
MGVRFEVTKPTTSWLFALLDGLTGGPGSDYQGKLPEVAIISSAGEPRVLDVLDTEEEANNRLAVITDDLATLDLDTWCAHYEVPESFFDGE